MTRGPITRGHIACPTNIPPLIYYFQYNPATVSLTKTAVYNSDGLSKSKDASLATALGRGSHLQEINKNGLLSHAASFVSTADAKRFSKEGDRILSFKLYIDGTENGRRERPSMRSADQMSIIDDLNLLETFLIPAPGNSFDVALRGKSTFENWRAKRQFQANDWAAIWYAQPPVASVGLGDISFSGWVTEMKTTISQWNAALEPVRAQVDLTLVEKPDDLGTMIGHLKRHIRLARGLHKQYAAFDLGEYTGLDLKEEEF